MVSMHAAAMRRTGAAICEREEHGAAWGELDAGTEGCCGGQDVMARGCTSHFLAGVFCTAALCPKNILLAAAQHHDVMVLSVSRQECKVYCPRV